jgi:hypothetical protein
MLTYLSSEEEEPDDYPFPLTLKQKKGSGPNSPAPLVGSVNGLTLSST